MGFRRVVFAVAAIVAGAALTHSASADDASGDNGALISLSNLKSSDVQERCQELKDAVDGRDVCSELGDALNELADGTTVADLTPDGSLCADFLPYDPPADDADTIAYLEEAILTNPVPCYLNFNSVCEADYGDDDLAAIAAFTNWMVTYSTVYTELTQGEDSNISPSCLAALSPSDFSSLLGGLQAQNVQQYDGPGVSENTPVAVDWRARGFTTPVTSQSGGTCWVHASFNWAGSMALLYNVTDLSGEYPMTTDTILSPQAYIDCMSAGCDDGGFPGTVLPWILGNPSPANARYPYLTDDAATAKNVSCRTAPGNPQCTSYVSNDTLLFPLPSEIGFTEAQYNPVSMSESQMVEALATLGPLIISVAAGDLMSAWVPPRNGTLVPMNGSIAQAAANPSKSSLCAAEGINHVVLLTGYNMQERWFQFKNSWGTNIGQQGYFYTRMSDPKSDDFTNPNYDSVCGLNEQIYVWTVNSAAPALAPAAAPAAAPAGAPAAAPAAAPMTSSASG